MGVESRHAHQRSGVIHVNNVHLEYASTAYSTQYKHVGKALGTWRCRDKRATGCSEKLTRVQACACVCIRHLHETSTAALMETVLCYS